MALKRLWLPATRMVHSPKLDAPYRLLNLTLLIDYMWYNRGMKKRIKLVKSKVDLIKSKMLEWFNKHSLIIFRVGSSLFILTAIFQFASGKKESLFALLSIANAIYWFNLGDMNFKPIYEPTWQSKMSRVAPLFYLPPILAIAPALLIDKKHNTLPVIGVVIFGYVLVAFLGKWVVAKHTATTVKNKDRALKHHIKIATPCNTKDDTSFGGYRWFSKEEIDAEKERSYQLWAAIDMPTQRKLDLIDNKIKPEHALDPDIVAMGEKDLKVVKALSITLNENSLPLLD
jgi:hypothetical protein